MKKREYRASALVVSLLVLAAILVTAMSVSLVSIKERSISSNVAKSSQAFQNAVTGVENVLYNIYEITQENDQAKISQISDCQSSGKIEKDNYEVQLMDSNGVEIDCDSDKNISDIATVKSVGTDDNGRTQRAILASIPTITFSCGDTVAGVGSDTNTYGTVIAEDGRCWLDRNLGAPHVAKGSKNDSASNGWYYQWGRLTDGHQIPTSGITVTLSSTDVPGHSNFIVSKEDPYDWRSPQNNKLWQGINGINNPCPKGFRLPTVGEWQTLVSDASITDSDTAYNSSLKLSLAGFRETNGVLVKQGSTGYYWSSSVVLSAYSLKFDLSSVDSEHTDDCGRGFSIRCIKD